MSFQSAGGSAFQSGGLALAQQGTADSRTSAEAMQALMRETGMLEIQHQQETGLMQMLLKLSEALSKMFKALGEAVKGLVG